MLPDVRNKILDGAMGIMGANATGCFAAIGVAANFGQGLLTFTDTQTAETALGDGPLRDLLVSALSVAKTTVYTVALEGTIPGTLSAVSPGGENIGTGTVAVSGNPRNEYTIRVEILSSGTLNHATFRVITDGLPGKQVTVPATYVIPGTGITGTFTEGDTYTFWATEPSATNGEVLEAVNRILEAKVEIEWIAVAGVSAAPLWAALATKAEGAAEIFQYLFFIAQARYHQSGETLDQWVNGLCGTER